MSAPAFGATLKACRERVGLSQAQLARDAGVDASYVNIIERGRQHGHRCVSTPRRAVVAALGLALGDVTGLLLAAGYAPASMGQEPLLARLCALLGDPAQREILDALCRAYERAAAPVGGVREAHTASPCPRAATGEG